MARYTLTIDFDDRLDPLYTQLAASLTVNELRKCSTVTIQHVELVDHTAVTLDNTDLELCEYEVDVFAGDDGDFLPNEDTSTLTR